MKKLFLFIMFICVNVLAWGQTERGKELLEKAKAGDASAQSDVAECYEFGEEGFGKDEIKKVVEGKYYNLEKTCNEIRPGYRFDVTCQGTVPVAVQCFLEGNNFKEVVRLAVSMGGDADTLGAIAGSMGEAYYGVPDFLKKQYYQYL